MGIRARDVIIVLVIFFIAFMFGYALGTYTTMKAVYEVAKNFIDVDYELIDKAVFQYNNHIGGCFNNEILQLNAS